MTKKTIGASILFLVFALSLFLLMIIPDNYSPEIYVTLVFDIITFASQLLLWQALFMRKTDAQGLFYRTPIMMLSMIYMVVQLVICLIVGFAGNKIGFKVSLIVNFVVCILMWILILMLGFARDHTHRIDSRQKNYHIEL